MNSNKKSVRGACYSQEAACSQNRARLACRTGEQDTDIISDNEQSMNR